jgi:hypothetical protein
MIEFTSTLLKPTGGSKPTRNLAGVGANFHLRLWPWADLDGCHRFGCGRVFLKLTLLPSLITGDTTSPLGLLSLLGSSLFSSSSSSSSSSS